MRKFKKLISLRKPPLMSSSKNLLAMIEKNYVYKTLESRTKIDRRKNHIDISNDKPMNTENKPVTLSLYGICFGIIIFCFLNVRIITQS